MLKQKINLAALTLIAGQMVSGMEAVRDEVAGLEQVAAVVAEQAAVPARPYELRGIDGENMAQVPEGRIRFVYPDGTASSVHPDRMDSQPVGVVQVVRLGDEEVTFRHNDNYPSNQFQYVQFDNIDMPVSIFACSLRQAVAEVDDIIGTEPQRAGVLYGLGKLLRVELQNRAPQEAAGIEVGIAPNQFELRISSAGGTLFEFQQDLPRDAFVLQAENRWILENPSVVSASTNILAALTDLLGEGVPGLNAFTTTWTTTIADLINRRGALAEAMVNFIRTAHSAVG